MRERPRFLHHKHQINTKQDFRKSQTNEKVKKNRSFQRNKRFNLVETERIELLTSTLPVRIRCCNMQLNSF